MPPDSRLVSRSRCSPFFVHGLPGRADRGAVPEAGRPEELSRGPFRAPLLVLAAAFWAGIALSTALLPERAVSPTEFAVAAVLLALGAAAAFGFVAAAGRRAPDGPRWREAATAILVLSTFAAGFLNRAAPGSASSLTAAVRTLGADRLARPIRLEGALLGEPEHFGRRSLLRLGVERLAANRREWPVRGAARITVDGNRAGLAELARGSRVEVWARVSEPRPAGNPGGRRPPRRVAVFGSVKSGLLVRETAPAPAPFRLLRRARAAIRQRLLDSGLPPPTVGLAAAVLIGDRTLAPPELERAFRDAGTLHLMAVSGLHVGLVALLIYGAAILLGAERRTALAALLAALPLYAALAGGRPSVVRAVLMAGALIVGMRRGLSGTALNGLGLAAILLLAVAPGNALDVGFQLSFAATLAILAAVRPGDPAAGSWERPPFWRAWLVGAVVVTLAAQLASFPIIAWHFGRVVIGGVMVAIPAALLAGPVLGLGFGWLLLGAVPLLGDALRSGFGASAEALIGLSEWAASLRFGAFPVARPGLAWLAAWFAPAIFVLVRRDTRRRFPRRLAVALIVVLAFSTLPLREPADGTLRLTALDVGMGDALVLSLPAGGAVLVDGGTAFEGFSAGEAVVVPFLAEAGHRRLRAVVATHGDLDHIGGLPAVLRDFAVEEVWEGFGTADDDRRAVRRFGRERRRRGIPLRRLRAGDRFPLGGAEFSVLAAGEPGGDAPRHPNDRSLVLAVGYAGRRILLTGDAGEAAERRLLARYGGALRAEVLKVGHHGSRSSTTPAFLAAVRPRIALVSARADPRRRLPDPRVLDRLREAGARVYRTDRSGAITVAISADGRLSVEPFRAGREPMTP